MVNTRLSIFVILFLCLKIEAFAQSECLYVSNRGYDRNDGSKSSPLETIQKALELSREKRIKKIIIKGGVYYQTSLKFLPADSGLVMMAEPGTHPVIYGGTLINGWKAQGQLYVADVPGVGDRKWDFRSLTVNNEIRSRARVPDKGFLAHKSEWSHKWISSSAGGWDKKPSKEDLTTIFYNKEDVSSDIDIRNAEITVFHLWDESYSGITENDTFNSKFILSTELTHPAGSFYPRNENANKYVIWNTFEGLNQPGQWYLDRTNEKLFYYPIKGESINIIKCVAPIHDNILFFERGCKNITINGLIFSSANSPLLCPGYAAIRPSGAISGKEISEIHFKDVRVENTSGWGIKLSGNKITFSGCEIRNTGAGGIQIDGENYHIDSCLIHDVGLVYNGSVGIFGSGNGNIISHCELFNIPYCGINSIGNNSEAKNNLFYNIKTFMQDGGAIYSFGDSCVTYKNNVVLQHKSKTAITGHYDFDEKNNICSYYFDEMSKKCLAENNLAVNTRIPALLHMADRCSYTNNIFIDKGTICVSYANSFNVSFERNIFIANNIIFAGPASIADKVNFDRSQLHSVMQTFVDANGIISFKNNILWAKDPQVIQEEYVGYKKYFTNPFELRQGTQFIKPGFRNLKKANFSFRINSPESKMGFQVLDFDNVGCTGSFKSIFKKML